MIARQPYLPRFMAGGPGNPLGARAMYLGTTVYRIHGTNRPDTIGTAVSSGCFRLVNTDVADLYERVPSAPRSSSGRSRNCNHDAVSSKPIHFPEIGELKKCYGHFEAAS